MQRLLVERKFAPDAAARMVPALAAIADWLAVGARHRIVGICGPQGSGKSTISALLAEALARGAGLKVAILSIDDFYLSRAARARLADDIHPLFRTRGVPGTHDVALAVATLTALGAPGETRLPRFDKASDDVVPVADWPVATGPADLILFEGWCVGARPEAAAALAEPVNALERNEDPDGRWRRAVNTALAGPYRALFGRIDRLLLLAAPSFDRVFAWRREQERALAARRPDGAAIMDDAAIARFIMHYERLTRHIIAEIPERADALLPLGPNREYGTPRFRPRRQ